MHELPMPRHRMQRTSQRLDTTMVPMQFALYFPFVGKRLGVAEFEQNGAELEATNACFCGSYEFAFHRESAGRKKKTTGKVLARRSDCFSQDTSRQPRSRQSLDRRHRAASRCFQFERQPYFKTIVVRGSTRIRDGLPNQIARFGRVE